MHLTDKQVQSFRELFKQDTGREISMAEARWEAECLLFFVKIGLGIDTPIEGNISEQKAINKP